MNCSRARCWSVFSDTVRDATDSKKVPLGEAGLAEALQGKLHLSAEELVVAAREVLNAHASASNRKDLTVLVVKRNPAD